MHADLIAALKAGYPIVHLVTVTLPAHTIRWSTGGFVKWGADTWSHRDATYGVLDAISDITDGIDDDASPVSLTIIPPSLSSLAALSASDAQGGWVTIHLAALDPTTGLLAGTPYLLHLGELDQPRLRAGRGRRLEYDVITGEARGLLPNEEQRQTDAFHQFVWPGERGNEYATDGTKRVWWRADEPKNAIGALFGRGLDDDKAIQFTYEPNAPLAFPFGRCGYGGDIRYRVGYGPTNRWQSIFATFAASGPIEGLISVAFDDEVTSFDGSDRATNGDHAGEMWFDWLPGNQPSAALTSPTGTNAHTAPAPGWTSDHKLSGRAAYVWTGKENSKEDEYRGGIPKPLLTFNGLKGYDPLTVGCSPVNPATWVFLQEGARCALNWAMGRWEGDSGGGLYGVPYQCKPVGGLAAPWSTIDVQAFVDAAGHADDNGWTMAGVAFSDQDKVDVLEDMLRASGAVRSRRCGMISCVSFAAIVPSVLTATAADTLGEPTITLAASRLDRLNTGIPSFWNEASRWEMTPVRAISNPDWVTEDGGRRSDGFEFRYVPSADQAAQLCYLEIAHAREPIEATVDFKPWMMQLEPGQAFDWDAPEFLLDGTKVRVRKRTWSPMACVAKITFRQETDAKYADAFAQTGTAPPPTVPEPPPVAPTVPPPTIDSIAIVFDGGVPRARIRIANPDDENLTYVVRWRVVSASFLSYVIEYPVPTSPLASIIELTTGVLPIDASIEVGVAFLGYGLTLATADWADDILSTARAGARRPIGRSVQYPTSATDTTISIVAFDAYMDDGATISLPADTITGLTPSTSYGVFWKDGDGYEAEVSPATTHMTTGSWLFIGWQATEDGGGVFPSGPPAPGGWGGDQLTDQYETP